MSTDESLRITVLGSVGATRHGAVLDLGGKRQRAVLAALVLARGETVPADRLADAVWGSEGASGTSGALQAYVSHLRRRLEPDAVARARQGVIVRHGPGYAVELEPDAVDAWRFEALVRDPAPPSRDTVAALTEALRLWRGPAYADYAGEPWVEAEVVRLTGLRSLARERLASARLETGESSLLVPELEALVADEPLREERWRLLALALYRAQRQADALGALRRARQTLAEELGVDPGPALRALEAEVLAQSPLLDARPPHQDRGSTPQLPRPRAAEAPPAPAGALPGSDLVDRRHELAVLTRAVDDVRTGRAGLVVVEGPAGIGKTRLLGELTALAAARDLAVLSARGSQLERSFGFGAVRQLFEPLLVGGGGAELLGGAAASAQGVFADADAEHPSDGSFAVLHGLYWLTVNLSRRGPLVLVVDDVQWCDRGSLRFLAYLVKRLEGLPVLVVAAMRTGEPHEDESLLAELAFDPEALALRPEPLSSGATSALVDARLGAPAQAFADACHRTTSGNPLLLRQLLRALESAGVPPDAAHADMVRAIGSRAVSGLVLMRLRRMPAEATAVARAVAVLGGTAQLPSVAALARLPEEPAATALAGLSRTEVLRDAEPLGFVHPLVRDAVYHDIPAPERALMHEKAAAVLRQSGATPEQVAAQLLLAPRRGDAAAVSVLRAAARSAVGRGATDSAVTLLRRALDEPVADDDRAELLLELGTRETDIDGAASIVHLTEALERMHQDDPRRGEVTLLLARTHVFLSEPGVATRVAREAAATTPDSAPDTRQGLLAMERISGFMHGLEPQSYRSGPEPVVVGAGPGARMLAATLAWERALAGTDREGAVALARFALEDDLLLSVDNGLFWILAANTRTLADDEVGDFWDRAGAAAHASGALFSAMSTNLWRGFGEWHRGELHEALQSLADAVEQLRMWGSGVGEGYAHALRVHACLDVGDHGAARDVADAALQRLHVGEGARLLSEAVVRLLAAEGRHAEALAHTQQIVDPLGIGNPAWAGWRGWKAEALAGLGQGEQARSLAAQEVVSLRRWGAPSWLGSALRRLGELEGPAGLAHLREAEQLLRPTTAVLELARARVSLASLPQLPDGEALPLLARAVEAARACGAAGLRSRAAAEAARRGTELPSLRPEPEAPTRTERRVLDLTAAGMDEHEVAQQLLLTPGTVRRTLEAASTRARA